MAERALLGQTTFSHAIVRPTLIFGSQDILVNNIAWVLRRLPLFVIAGDGSYTVQPVAASEVARIAVHAGAREDDLDAVMANMLATTAAGSGPPFGYWLAASADELGHRFVSERRLNWR